MEAATELQFCNFPMFVQALALRAKLRQMKLVGSLPITLIWGL
ncbi:hypothetical protein [Bosea vestrisii]|uniref:Uncharacterized protein n=1 Tax=Bosea vestrisii TaxID=151416 RepID=A0ABW0HA33_9HYPH